MRDSSFKKMIEKIIFYFEKNVLIFLIITINICLNKPIVLIGIKKV
jgi:hypothetical protein